MMPVIRFEHVSKLYRIGVAAGPFRSAWQQMRHAFTGAPLPEGASRQFWALDDVSFNVERGEVMGIIGHNGAGKTTILKLLSKVTRPTAGNIAVEGRLSALIELGAGFHPDLTGRENIFLNAAILGLKAREIRTKLDSIIAFSELEQFIDTPVKRYSSGMYVRLGFAVAVHVEPDVLLVDEVLAVGDIAFQRKCLDKVREIRDKGTTVVFVSHNMRTMESLCNRGLWLEHGRVRQMGDLRSIIAAYNNETNRLPLSTGLHPAAPLGGQSDVRFTSLRLLDGSGAEAEVFDMQSPLAVEIGYEAQTPVHDPSFDIAIYADTGTRVCTTTTRLSGEHIPLLQGQGVVRCMLDAIPFTPGRYSITLAIFDKDDLGKYAQWHHAAYFTVQSRVLGDVTWHLTQEEHGVVYLPTGWQIEQAVPAQPAPVQAMLAQAGQVNGRGALSPVLPRNGESHKDESHKDEARNDDARNGEAP